MTLHSLTRIAVAAALAAGIATTALAQAPTKTLHVTVLVGGALILAATLASVLERH